MKTTITRTVLVGLVALLCGGAFADGVPLTRPGDESNFTAAERTRIAEGRKQAHFKDVTAVTVNRAALLSNVITFGGVEFVKDDRAPKPLDVEGVELWHGRSTKGDTLTITAGEAAMSAFLYRFDGRASRISADGAGKGFVADIDSAKLPPTDVGDGTAQLSRGKQK